MNDNEEIRRSLSRLKLLGVQIAIDDFGTGYSSLSYIKRFSINKLKIDRSFICDIESSDCDRQLVRTIINMGHDLSLRVTAEGVENARQLDFLENAGCDQAQGHYVGRPMNATQLTRWLSTPASEPKPMIQAIPENR